jgi:hypothetical protein
MNCRPLDEYSALLYNENPPREETVVEIQDRDSGDLLCYAAPEQAEHICRCVNTHDALLHAIAVLRDGVNLAVENWKQQTPEQKELFREKLRIADATLKGDQP